MGCLAKSREECITCLNLPESHRRRVRTTNALQCLIEEDRRRGKVTSAMPDGRLGVSDNWVRALSGEKMGEKMRLLDPRCGSAGRGVDRLHNRCSPN